MKKLGLDVVEIMATKFRSDVGLSASEAVNIKSLLRKLNIMTLFRPLSDSFYGMSLKSSSKLSFMLINSNNPKGRQHFSIAHELFHLFIDENPKPHICNSASEGSVTEQNANSFAAAFLMPQMGVLSFISQSEIKSKAVELATVIRLEQYFSVSRSALLVRLKSCGIISQKCFSELSTYKAIETAKQYGYDTALYKSGNEGLFIGDFGEKARQLFDSELISEGHYNELLNLITHEAE